LGIRTFVAQSEKRLLWMKCSFILLRTSKQTAEQYLKAGHGYFH
jgi:hypothetical protein